MLKGTVLAVAAILLISGSGWAMDCPVKVRVEGTHEAQQEAIRKAPTCKRALAIMEACAYTASGDVGLGNAVHENCEPLFLPRLRKAQRRAYDREQKRCSDKYAHESGTMYRSFTAFCQAESTVKYATKYGAKAK
jgi:hypothetical protein